MSSNFLIDELPEPTFIKEVLEVKTKMKSESVAPIVCLEVDEVQSNIIKIEINELSHSEKMKLVGCLIVITLMDNFIYAL